MKKTIGVYNLVIILKQWFSALYQYGTWEAFS